MNAEELSEAVSMASEWKVKKGCAYMRMPKVPDKGMELSCSIKRYPDFSENPKEAFDWLMPIIERMHYSIKFDCQGDYIRCKWARSRGGTGKWTHGQGDGALDRMAWALCEVFLQLAKEDSVMLEIALKKLYA